MTELYNKVPERFLEKLFAYKEQLDFTKEELRVPFPYDYAVMKNELVRDLKQETEEEFNYEMSESQCSWTVHIFVNTTLEEYNKTAGTNLTPTK